MMNIEITDRNEKILNKRIEEIFDSLNTADYPEQSEYIDQKISHLFYEIGDIMFWSTIGVDRVAQLEAVMYSPEPEPEPMPEVGEGEHIRYCNGCEIPTPHKWVAPARVECTRCAKQKFLAVPLALLSRS